MKIAMKDLIGMLTLYIWIAAAVFFFNILPMIKEMINAVMIPKAAKPEMEYRWLML